jgi:hypothetical protein
MAISPRTILAAALAALTSSAAAGAELSSLPYDLRYEQLSPAQQEVVRSRYDALSAGDEPPYPADGIGAILRPLQQAAGRIHMNGRVDAIADVGPDGTVRSVSLYQSPDPVVITPAVTQLLMLQKFKPGLCKGVPCAMPFALRVDLGAR